MRERRGKWRKEPPLALANVAETALAAISVSDHVATAVTSQACKEQKLQL